MKRAMTGGKTAPGESEAMKHRVLQVGSRQVVVKAESLKEQPTFKALALRGAGEQLLEFSSRRTS
jgi:hypothetical protein